MSSRPSSVESAVPPQPDHFYPSPFIRPNWRNPNDPGSCIWPEEDISATRGIPVFKPVWEEFQDFEGYVTALEPWGRRSGIIKVIPPKEWHDSLPSVVPQLAEVRLRNPIAQEMIGTSGLFYQSNMEKRKTYSVREWANMCDKDPNRTPSPAAVLKRERSDKDSPRKHDHRAQLQIDEDDEDARDEKEVEMRMDLAPDCEQQTHPTPEFLTDSTTPPGKASTATPSIAGGTTQCDVSEDRKFFASFDPKRSWLPSNTKAEDYTPEVCAKLEKNFWRSIGNGGSPAWYGADLKGSLFTDETTFWNVASLPNPLSRLLGTTGRKLPGVNTPYLYFGMWRAAFAWHVEDMDLCSINYIHFGAPKLWWAIPSEKAKAFERTMKGYFPGDAKTCPQFLRHKSFLVSPTILANNSCRPNVLVQHQGEFVITFPQGYHAGFNLGFNCAESTNFALDGWEEVVRKAGWCKCEKDSVKLDIDALILEANEIEGKHAKNVKAKGARLSKKRKIEEIVIDHAASPVKKTKNRAADIVKPTIENTRSSSPHLPKACLLCPSSNEETLIKVHDLPHTMRHMLGVQAWAHESCAAALPETWVDMLDDEKWVFGVDVIEKARWDLKCAACTKPTLKSYGAKIQCTRGKCPRAFHVSCALDKSEILYQEVETVERAVLLASDNAGDATIPKENINVKEEWEEVEIRHADDPICAKTTVFDGNRRAESRVLKTIQKPVIELLCSIHNPNMRVLSKQRKDEARRKNVLALKEGDRIRIRLSSGVFEVTLLKVDEITEKVEVMWDDHSRRAIKWGSIHWGPVSDEVLAASKAKQEAKEEEVLEAKLRRYQESLRLAKKRATVHHLPAVSIYDTPSSTQTMCPTSSSTSYSISTTGPPSSDIVLAAPSTAARHVAEQATGNDYRIPRSQQNSVSSEGGPLHMPPYPRYPYPPGYWAAPGYVGYWQHASSPGHGWYDYYGRWHETSVPAYGHYGSRARSQGEATYSRHGEQGTSRLDTQTYVRGTPTPRHKDLTANATFKLGPNIDIHRPASTAITHSTAEMSVRPSETHTDEESHPPTCDTLSNIDLIPLLNTLMKNERVRTTLLKLRDSLASQLDHDNNSSVNPVCVDERSP
ncbi:JmjC-domain-containing protein [Dacryopinax primogenitus]|uniref:[histone H3]-trimethyl-L-lysine(9) demethylase n=1 Tax=Dacryopinax primogenitus (strain DJM 731) TaxID=1858805 RepID=M5FT23_DACPD|nr:JmjC-domain-containing protein [Dacryopinax primogenitus]EJT98514.1 JmjC-domain-containing protein [Dacryopinax primogenitus]